MRPLRSAAAWVVVALAILVAPRAEAKVYPEDYDPPGEAYRKHISLGLGVERFTTDNFERSGMDTALLGHAGFRYRFADAMDAVLDFRVTRSAEDVVPDFQFPNGSDASVVTLWSGVGVRWTKPGRVTRPYVQAALYFIDQQNKQSGGSFEFSDRLNGLGVGVVGGMEMRLAEHVWFPVEAHVLTGSTHGRITGIGADAGVTFGFGTYK
jgi:hypothetical protein